MWQFENHIFNVYNLYNCSLTEHIKLVASLRAEIALYQKNNSELKQLNQVLKDEYQALQLAFTKHEERLRKCQVTLLHLIIFCTSKSYVVGITLLLVLKY